MTGPAAILRLVEPHGAGRDGTLWMAPASTTERSLLSALEGPVLDVGCGPGRHVVALAEAGIPAMGIDVTPAVLQLARARGAPVLSRSVFDRVPAAGRWGSALLLDGNVGIGADPVTLLERVSGLLRPGGVILVEGGPPGSAPQPRTVRLECAGDVGPAFPWADIAIDRVANIARSAGLRDVSILERDKRHFAVVRTAPDRAGSESRR